MRVKTGIIGLALLAAAGCTEDGAFPDAAQITTGRGDFKTFCAGCHGSDAKGGGPVADVLNVEPPDLTGITARNGGTYPRGKVMATIYGYTKADKNGANMPEFGPLIDGKTVFYDAGDGVQTPTPWRLVALANYLESIQAKTK